MDLWTQHVPTIFTNAYQHKTGFKGSDGLKFDGFKKFEHFISIVCVVCNINIRIVILQFNVMLFFLDNLFFFYSEVQYSYNILTIVVILFVVFLIFLSSNNNNINLSSYSYYYYIDILI